MLRTLTRPSARLLPLACIPFAPILAPRLYRLSSSLVFPTMSAGTCESRDH